MNRKKSEDAVAAEQKRHNEEMESLARGKGVFLNPPGQAKEGGSIKEAIKNLAKESGLEEGSKRPLKNTLLENIVI